MKKFLLLLMVCVLALSSAACAGPEVPDAPDTPAAPDKSDESDTPDTPSTPNEPVEPNTPAEPDTPAIPETPDEVYEFDISKCRSEQWVLVATWTNNAKAASYTSIVTKEGEIAVIEIGAAPTDAGNMYWTYSYKGTENIDSLCGLPVTVWIDNKNNVVKVELIGSVIAEGYASSFKLMNGKYFCGGKSIDYDPAVMNFVNNKQSTRAWVKFSGGTWQHNASASKFFNAISDEWLTMVDTDGDKYIDWIREMPRTINGLVLDSGKIQSDIIEGGIPENEVGAVFETAGFGSWDLNGWFYSKRIAYEWEDGEDRLLSEAYGKYLNVRTAIDSTKGTAIYSGPQFRVTYILSFADTVEGVLEEVNYVSATNITVKVGGKSYAWTTVSNANEMSDGASRVNAGCTLLQDNSLLGKQVRLVLDKAGNIVKIDVLN